MHVAIAVLSDFYKKITQINNSVLPMCQKLTEPTYDVLTLTRH